MSWSIPLLRARGIAIKVHVTFALILIWAVYSWGIATGAGLQGALFGVVATLLLFVCVTLHELGHAFQALSYGIAVEDITLLPIGGVARLQVPDRGGRIGTPPQRQRSCCRLVSTSCVTPRSPVSCPPRSLSTTSSVSSGPI